MSTQTYSRQFWFLVALFSSVVSANADPIEIPTKSVTPEITFLISFAILLEVVCIWLLLWRSQKPRFFILWLIGMHLLTYPVLLGILWLTQNMRPAFAASIGEGIVVVVEGMFIYLICRFFRPAESKLAKPSVIKCLFASLIGNLVSAGSFPVLLLIYGRFASS